MASGGEEVSDVADREEQQKNKTFVIEDLRARCEALQNALAVEKYETAAGLKAGSDMSAIYRRHADVTSREAIEFVRAKLAVAEAKPEETAPPKSVIETLSGLLVSTTDDVEKAIAPAPEGTPDPEEAARLRNLLEYQVEEFTGHEVKSILDEVATRESAARVKVGQEELAFRKLAAEVANSDDRERRGQLESAQMAFIEQLTPLYAERIQIEHGIARSFGKENYSDLWQSVSGIDLRALDALFQGFLARTEDMYREAMGWAIRKRTGLALADARRHDVTSLFRGEEFDDFFPKAEIREVPRRFLSEMGVDITAGGNISFDLEPREKKSPRTFCATIEVPQRVVLVIQLEGGRRDWQHLLHELGHGLHFGHTDAEAPYEFRRLGDYSLTETYAFLFQYLLTDRSFLKRYLGMQRPKDYLFLAYLEKLTFLRRYAAKLHYELLLHTGEGVEGKDALYEQILGDALKIRYPRELFLYDVDRAFYTARYLRAWNMEALLTKHLVHYFDEDWFRNPRTGQFLKRHWAHGHRFRVEELAKEIGYGALNTAALEAELARNL
jgi:hypothetical protein